MSMFNVLSSKSIGMVGDVQLNKIEALRDVKAPVTYRNNSFVLGTSTER